MDTEQKSESSLFDIECILLVLKEEIAILRQKIVEPHCSIPEILEYLDRQIDNKKKELTSHG